MGASIVIECIRVTDSRRYPWPGNTSDKDMFKFDKSTHSGLIMPYGDIDLGQHWLR